MNKLVKLGITAASVTTLIGVIGHFIGTIFLKGQLAGIGLKGYSPEISVLEAFDQVGQAFIVLGAFTLTSFSETLFLILNTKTLISIIIISVAGSLFLYYSIQKETKEAVKHTETLRTLVRKTCSSLWSLIPAFSISFTLMYVTILVLALASFIAIAILIGAAIRLPYLIGESYGKEVFTHNKCVTLDWSTDSRLAVPSCIHFYDATKDPYRGSLVFASSNELILLTNEKVLVFNSDRALVLEVDRQWKPKDSASTSVQ